MLDKNGDQSCVTFRAQVAGEVRKHAVEQFVGVGSVSFRFVGRLAENGSSLVERLSAGTVIETVGTHAMGAALRGMAE